MLQITYDVSGGQYILRTLYATLGGFTTIVLSFVIYVKCLR